MADGTWTQPLDPTEPPNWSARQASTSNTIEPAVGQPVVEPISILRGKVARWSPQGVSDVSCSLADLAALLDAYDAAVAEIGRTEDAYERQNRTITTLEARVQREAAKARDAEGIVHRLASVRCWTNEDGKSFMFADDLLAALQPAIDQGSAEPVLRPGGVAAGAATTEPPAADPASHHYLTFAVEQGRLLAHITCTAAEGALCRLDCSIDGCDQEEQPPHTDRDGMSVHGAVDAGLCRVVEALGNGRSVPAAYQGLPGAVGTVPVDAWLDADGPGWDLPHLHATGADLDWTARDEANHRVQHDPDQWQSTAAAQFRAGYDATRTGLGGGCVQ